MRSAEVGDLGCGLAAEIASDKLQSGSSNLSSAAFVPTISRIDRTSWYVWILAGRSDSKGSIISKNNRARSLSENSERSWSQEKNSLTLGIDTNSWNKR